MKECSWGHCLWMGRVEAVWAKRNVCCDRVLMGVLKLAWLSRGVLSWGRGWDFVPVLVGHLCWAVPGRGHGLGPRDFSEGGSICQQHPQELVESGLPFGKGTKCALLSCLTSLFPSFLFPGIVSDTPALVGKLCPRLCFLGNLGTGTH